MSLQVWLPLTKDLRQQGLSVTTYTQNSGTAITSGGKLGSCLTATSNATVVVNLPSLATMLANGKTYTLSCWVKITNNVTSGWVIKLGTNTCGLWWAASTARWVWNENDNGKRCANVDVSSDTNWHHLCIVVDKTVSGKITTKQYVDGALAADYPGTTWDCSSHAQPEGTTITISPYVAQLNDIRLYDHCLSPMEVKRISQGLVLHYPLNREGWGQENLLLSSNVEKTVNSTIIEWSLDNDAKANIKEKIYVISADIKCSSNNSKIDCYVRSPSTSQSMSPATVFTGITTEYKRYFLVSSCTENQSGTPTTFCFNCNGRNSSTTGVTFSIKNVKLEYGNKVTPWCPNSADTLATTMGLNGTTEYDTSGFSNNGTRTGTFSWTSDTPKYSVSQYFNGSSYILTDSGTFSWFGFDKCTVAVWMKPTTTPSSWAGTFGIAHNNSSSNKSFVIGNYGGTFTVQSANGGWVNIQSSNLPVNEWHHCVATLDGTTIKMYFDGELVNTYTTSWGSTTVASDTRVQVGNDLPGSDEIYQGYYSDARIYATALSADDVKALYENSAYIATDGTMYAYDFLES